MKYSKFTSFLVSLSLSACVGIDTNRIAPGYSEAFSSIKNAILGYESNLITPELIKNIPYASSLLRIGKGPEGLMILESINGEKQTWVSADGIYLVIEGGKIVQTAGLDHNLSKIDRSFSLLDRSTKPSVYPHKIYYSFDKPALNNLQVNVTYKNLGTSKIKLFNQELLLTEIEEEISNKEIGWNITNKYWLDTENVVWKSEQFISPRLPVFQIEITKKPSR